MNFRESQLTKVLHMTAISRPAFRGCPHHCLQLEPQAFDSHSFLATLTLPSHGLLFDDICQTALPVPRAM